MVDQFVRKKGKHDRRHGLTPLDIAASTQSSNGTQHTTGRICYRYRLSTLARCMDWSHMRHGFDAFQGSGQCSFNNSISLQEHDRSASICAFYTKINTLHLLIPVSFASPHGRPRASLQIQAKLARASPPCFNLGGSCTSSKQGRSDSIKSVDRSGRNLGSSHIV